MEKPKVARVMLNLSLDKFFEYLIPDELLGEVGVGSQVEVRFGHSLRRAVVVDIVAESEYKGKLSPIVSITANNAKLPEKLLELGVWMAEYYCCAREQVLKSLLPGAIRNGKIKEKLHKVCTLKQDRPTTPPKGEKQR